MNAKDVIELALSEVGYLGKKSNSQLYDKTANTSGKYNKYAQELYEGGYYNANKNGFNYCAIFTDWLFYHLVGCKDKAIEVKPYNIYNASCTWAKKAYQSVGRLSKSPAVGAQVFFLNKAGGEVSHTGMIVEITGDELVTVEGNVNNNVVSRRFKLDDPILDSFGLPFYEEDEPEDDDIEVSKEELAALLQQVENASDLIGGAYNKLKDAGANLTAALLQLDAVKEALKNAHD